MGKGGAKGGNDASKATISKSKGKGAPRTWSCSKCQALVEGNFCSTCGTKWIFGAVHRDRADPPSQQGKRALGRTPPATDTSKSPTYRQKLLQPTNNCILEAVLERLDQLGKQNSLPSAKYTDQSPSSKGDTDRSVVKPLPGREVFVDFDGKSCSLDDLNAMLRPTVRSLGNDSNRAGEIREAIGRAHAKRQEQMDPQSRIEYLEKILGTKTKEAENNENEVLKCQDEIAALADKLEKLRARGAQVADDIGKVKNDILAASAEIGKDDAKPGFTAKRCDILQTPLFRLWLRHNQPEVYEFQEDTGWSTISDKLLLRFKRYEVHCLRVRYNLGRIAEMAPGPERDDLEKKTLESADWMFDTDEYFPDDLQGFKAGLQEGRANPLQADNANLFASRKRDGDLVGDERQKKKRVNVSGPYLNQPTGGIEAIEVDDTGIQSYDVVLQKASAICKATGKSLLDERYFADLIYSIEEECEVEAEAAKAFLLAIIKRADQIGRFPLYDDYWLAIKNGLEVSA